MRGASRRPGFRITTVQALLFVSVCLLVGAQSPLHDVDLFDTHHGSHDPTTPFHEHPMLLLVSGVLIALGAFLGQSCRGAVLSARSGVRASAVARCDNDVGLHLLLSTFRI
jgi:hypothetical protein